MRHSILALAVFIQAAFCVSVSLADDAESIGYLEAIAQEAPPVVGETYHLRHSIMYEKGTHVATNYWRGSFLPINTKVTLTSLKSKVLKIRVVETGEEVEIKNVPDYTKKDIPTIARNLLTRTPVPIEKFGDKMARKIRSGEMAKGMTKEQVVMARGYPPAHKTPTLDADTWIYWPSRLVMQTIVFEDGVLTEGRGLD